MRYELKFYIPEDGILHSHRRGNIKFYIALTGWALYRRRDVFSVRYELGLNIPEDDILHSHSHEILKSNMNSNDLIMLPRLIHDKFRTKPGSITSRYSSSTLTDRRHILYSLEILKNSRT
jgi:hypothetical protein